MCVCINLLSSPTSCPTILICVGCAPGGTWSSSPGELPPGNVAGVAGGQRCQHTRGPGVRCVPRFCGRRAAAVRRARGRVGRHRTAGPGAQVRARPPGRRRRRRRLFSGRPNRDTHRRLQRLPDRILQDQNGHAFVENGRTSPSPSAGRLKVPMLF